MPDPVLLIAIPLGFAFLIPLLGFISRKIEKFVPPVAMAVNILLSIKLIPYVMKKPIVSSLGGFLHPFSINLYAGPVGLFFSLLISFVGFLVSLYAISYIKEGATQKYHMLFLLLLTGANGAALTADIFNLFVFSEILCISSYALVAYTGSKAGVESATKYLIQGSIGSAFFLIAIGLIYGQFGTLNMAEIAQHIHSVKPINIYLPIAMIISGIGVEAAIFPINAWLPDAHSSAPSTISAVLSGIAIKIGLYVILRFVFTIFGATNLLLILIITAIATVLVGEFSAFSQNNIKRMLAYSSTGQIGLILFAVSLGTSQGISAGFFQLITHTLSKSILFLSSGYMIVKAGSMDMENMIGMGKRMPVSSLSFTIGAFSLVGLPPFIGFPSKFLIVKAAIAKGDVLSIVLIILVLLGTVIEAAYFFRAVQTLYFKGDSSSIQRDEAPAIALIPLLLLIVSIIGIGVYPHFLTGFLNKVSSELLNRIAFIRGILG